VAAAAVVFCPLAVIEATQSGHNDSVVMVAVALFVWAAARRWNGVSLVAMAGGLVVKATALLPLGLGASEPLFRRFRTRLTPLRVLWISTAAALLAVVAWLVLSARFPSLKAYGAMIGSTSDAYEHCTRSWECLPRAVLRYALDWRMAAWTVGLMFRAGSVVWLLYASARAAQTERPLDRLGWIGKGLFVYFLFMHGWMMSWYLLLWLPLMPFCSRPVRRGMQVHIACALGYYALDLGFNCFPELGATRELLEAAVATGAPGLIYLVLEQRAERL